MFHPPLWTYLFIELWSLIKFCYFYGRWDDFRNLSALTSTGFSVNVYPIAFFHNWYVRCLWESTFIRVFCNNIWYCSQEQRKVTAPDSVWSLWRFFFTMSKMKLKIESEIILCISNRLQMKSTPNATWLGPSTLLERCKDKTCYLILFKFKSQALLFVCLRFF